MSNFRMITLISMTIFSLLIFSGCTTATGRPFPVSQVQEIQIGLTTKGQVKQMFGEPWRTGIEDGFKTWTYGQYSIENSRDLVIRFDSNDLVKSYSFSSSYPEDKDL